MRRTILLCISALIAYTAKAQITLEHTFDADIAFSVVGNEIFYCEYDSVGVTFYSEDYSEYKRVAIPRGADSIDYLQIYEVSRGLLTADNQLAFLVRIRYLSNADECMVMDESGTIHFERYLPGYRRIYVTNDDKKICISYRDADNNQFHDLYSLVDYTLEHTFPYSMLDILIGDKLYYTRSDTNTIVIYNDDYALYKEVTVPVDYDTIGSSVVGDFSDLYAPGRIAFEYEFRNFNGSVNYLWFVDEDANVLFQDSIHSGFRFTSVKKDILSVAERRGSYPNLTYQTKLYSLPDFTLEYTFDTDIDLEIVEDKLYYFEYTDKLLIYGEDYSLYKEVAMPGLDTITIWWVEDMQYRKYSWEKGLDFVVQHVLPTDGRAFYVMQEDGDILHEEYVTENFYSLANIDNRKFYVQSRSGSSPDYKYTTKIFAMPPPAPPGNVLFNVDMTNVDGFTEGTDVVYVTGSFAEWADPGQEGSIMLSDEEGDKIYSGYAESASGNIEYKYYINTGTAGVEWEGDPNRLGMVKDSATFNDVWGYYENVTFNVDMTNAEGFNASVDSVYVVDKNNLIVPGDSGSIKLADEDEDGIYSGTAKIEDGAIEYKYFINAGTTGAEFVDKWRKGAVAGNTVYDDLWADPALDVENIVMPASVKFYPNPARDVLYVLSDIPVDKVEIYTMSGSLVLLEKNATSGIKLSGLDEGVYIVKLTSDEYRINKKIIIAE